MVVLKVSSTPRAVHGGMPPLIVPGQSWNRLEESCSVFPSLVNHCILGVPPLCAVVDRHTIIGGWVQELRSGRPTTRSTHRKSLTLWTDEKGEISEDIHLGFWLAL